MRSVPYARFASYPLLAREAWGVPAIGALATLLPLRPSVSRSCVGNGGVRCPVTPLLAPDSHRPNLSDVTVLVQRVLHMSRDSDYKSFNTTEGSRNLGQVSTSKDLPRYDRNGWRRKLPWQQPTRLG